MSCMLLTDLLTGSVGSGCCRRIEAIQAARAQTLEDRLNPTAAQCAGWRWLTKMSGNCTTRSLATMRSEQEGASPWS
jgi:hypothetical protein